MKPINPSIEPEEPQKYLWGNDVIYRTNMSEEEIEKRIKDRPFHYYKTPPRIESTKEGGGNLPPPLEPQNQSKCCKAPTQVHSSDEGTNYYECLKCEKPCDLLPTLYAYTVHPNFWIKHPFFTPIMRGFLLGIITLALIQWLLIPRVASVCFMAAEKGL